MKQSPDAIKLTDSANPFWSLGFRPFFLLGSIWGVLTLLLWSLSFTGVFHWSGIHALWHGHEMLHGFTIAIIVGFLLTATQTWTNIRGVHGKPLIGLVLLWGVGRIMMVLGSPWPIISGIIDLLFLPSCIWMLRIYFNRQNLRQVPLLIALGCLWCSNLFYHLGMNGLLALPPQKSLAFAVCITIFMIVVIGGRVIPFFTSRVIPQYTYDSSTWLDHFSIILTALFVCSIFIPIPWLNFFIAGGAAVLNISRMVKWYDHRIWQHPILFILYIGFAWVICGFLASALSEMGKIPTSSSIHVFTAGAISTMILAMMSRVSLGHTKRPIKATSTIKAAFACITAAGVFRTLAIYPLYEGFIYFTLCSAILWMVSFILFIASYYQILTQSSQE